MGCNYYKKTVVCDCGCQYGSNCGRKSIFLFKYIRTVDIGQLYYKNVPSDKEEKDCKYDLLLSLTDSELEALVDVLSNPNTIEPLSEEERNELK